MLCVCLRRATPALKLNEAMMSACNIDMLGNCTGSFNNHFGEMLLEPELFYEKPVVLFATKLNMTKIHKVQFQFLTLLLS